MSTKPNFEVDPVLTEVLRLKEYELISPIGSGGSATCFLVHSKKYNMNFVCKKLVLNENVICSKCEIEALRQLSSPEIINMYDYEIRPGSIYLFLEYCPNGSLMDIIKEGPLKGKTLIGMCKNLLMAINYIHTNRCAHLDIKPANILIDRFGRAKLADFGISRFINNPTQTSNQRAGTILFMAPEIFTSGRYDPFMADIWALGVTFYYIATKKVPWTTTSVEETKKSIRSGSIQFPKNFNNIELAQVIKMMLAIRPTERPTAEQLLKFKIFDDANKKDGFVFKKVAFCSTDEMQCCSIPSVKSDECLECNCCLCGNLQKQESIVKRTGAMVVGSSSLKGKRRVSNFTGIRSFITKRTQK